MLPNEAFLQAVVKTVKGNKLLHYKIIREKVALKNGTQHTKVKLPDVVVDTFLHVIEPVNDAAVSYGPYGSPEGYVDSMDISEKGVFHPGPAVIVDGDKEEIVACNRGSLLKYGEKKIYAGKPDTSSKDKKLIVTSQGEAEGGIVEIILLALDL